MQIRIIVKDIDDNMPRFLPSYHNMTLGVRVNAPVYTEITTLKAIDADPDAKPVEYNLLNVTFYRPRYNKKRLLLDIYYKNELNELITTKHFAISF